VEGIRDGRRSGGDALAGKEGRVRLRDVELGDVNAYVRMRCDPVMMAELGVPLPRAGVEDKLARDVRAVAAGSDWIKMIVPDEAAPDVVAENVTLWSDDEDGEPVSEVGWIVLPEFQGRGLGKWAVRMLLERPATMAAEGWCTRSRRDRTPRRTASASALISCCW
jgi:RimJ/RimL family protein N-acetyltransferase